MTRIWVAQKPECGQLYELDAKASSHLHVLRKKIGAKIELFDGNHGEYNTSITEISKKKVTVKVQSFNPEDRTISLDQTLLIADCSAQKMAWIVQKATELGVRSIQPITTRYSQSTGNKLTVDKLERFKAIIIQAAQQCGLNKLPNIQPSIALTDILPTLNPSHCYVGSPTGQIAANMNYQTDQIVWLVGPEGGWHSDELNIFKELNIQTIKVAPTILRMETAACALLTMGNIWSKD